MDKKEEAGSKQVATNAGELVRRSADSLKERQWVVRWKTAEMEYGEEGQVSGVMTDVSGTIYDKGVPVSDFFAETGQAPKDSDDLSLAGKVRIVGRKPKSTLTCNTVVWRPQLKRVEAKGNVKMDLPPWEVGGLNELWCRPDLAEVATPELFGKN